MELLLLLAQLGAQGANGAHQLRQRLRLLLQRGLGGLLAGGGRPGLQRAGQRGFQALRGGGAFAARQRTHQAQHGRAGHTGHRATEGQAQALHRGGEGGAHGGQIGRGAQRLGGAAQGLHCAWDEGAQHAQQHQQRGQGRGQRGRAARRRRQALQALAHRGAHGGGQSSHPGLGAGGGGRPGPSSACWKPRLARR
ncbi:MAG: hypothetical protein U1E77_11625 [Inhella sp.]